MQIVNVVPGSALNGGVGTYVQFFIKTFPNYTHHLISDGSNRIHADVNHVDIPGFTRLPSCTAWFKAPE